MLRTKKILPGAYEVLNTGAFRYRVSAKSNAQGRRRNWNIYKAERVVGAKCKAERLKAAKWELIDDDFSTKKEAVDWALNYAEDDREKIEAKEKGNSVGSGDCEKQELDTRVMAK